MTIVRGLLVLLLATPLLAKPPAQMKIAATGASKPVAVNCNKGESIQAALDKNGGPLTVEVRGICSENVVITQSNVTLHGGDPLTDGVKGVSTENPSVYVQSANNVLLQNLSLSDGAAAGFHAYLSFVNLDNCRILNNQGAGMGAGFSSFVVGQNMTISFNHGPAVLARNKSSIFAVASHIEGNTGFAGTATNGGLLSLLRSEVIGTRGILASGNGSYADVDCVSDPSPHPCSLQVTTRAATASLGGQAVLLEVGDFTGLVAADSNGMVDLIASRQQGTFTNFIDGFGQLIVEPGDSGDSRLAGTTNVMAFGRALLRATSTLAGSIQCSGAGDAWLDPTVIRAPGSSVTGCAHVP